MSLPRPTALHFEELSPDLIVVGSGAAGLTAALTAASRGLDVVVLEAASTIGGTTAVSGGVLWVPDNDRMRELGIADDLDAAKAYVQRVAAGKSTPERIAAWLDHANLMVRAIEEIHGENFAGLPTYPDYQPELEGGKAGGRSLDNPLFNTHELGDWRPLLRQNPITGRAPMTIGEAMAWGVFSKPFDFPYREVAQRAKDGIVHGGAALIGRSLKRALELGVRFAVDARVHSLLREEGRVCGVSVAYEGQRQELRGGAVVLASGGFEWNASFCADFLMQSPTAPTSPPQMQGDALVMSQAVGAKVANTSEAWWVPAVSIPGEEYDDAPMFRSEFAARCLPHSIIVNQQGRRFVNEALNYNDVVKPFLHVDPVRYRLANQPAWLVVDQQFLERYMFITAVPGRALPDYILQGETLEDLAAACGIDASGLVPEVARFNGFVAQGVDADFSRGEGAFERFYGDPRYEKNPNLGTLERGPYAAVPISIGAIGTKGGPVTNARAQVLDLEGQAIPGLYAAGNAQASPAGAGYPGAGSTISIAMTFGWLAAQDVAKGAFKEG